MNEISLIWDLDGTLLDSYEVIVDSLFDLYTEKGIEVNKESILFDIIDESVASFIKKMEDKTGIPFKELKGRYTEISSSRQHHIKAMEHAIELLEILRSRGIRNFVYTHRGETTEAVLANTKLTNYFEEIVTSLYGYPRKPNPEGLNYLINKYHLDKNNTYYVGDRSIDIECANNAHVKSIMFISSKSPATKTGHETFVVNDLLEIAKIKL